MNKIFAFCAVLVTALAVAGTTQAATLPMLENLIGDTNLTIGTTGEKVFVLQDFLRAEGLFALESTGYFGSITQTALKQYQTNNGLVASGTIDTATLAKMQTEVESIEIVAKAAIARNPNQVPVGLNTLETYINGLDVEAEETSMIVTQLQRMMAALERIMR